MLLKLARSWIRRKVIYLVFCPKSHNFTSFDFDWNVAKMGQIRSRSQAMHLEFLPKSLNLHWPIVTGN